MKSVTHVYAQSVTYVCAPCREGELLFQLNGSGLVASLARNGSWPLANLAHDYISHRNRGKIGLISGSLVAGAPAPEPVPAALS